MKVYDDVRVIRDSEYYASHGVKAGMLGTIIEGEIRNNTFFVVFIDPKFRDKNYVITEENMYDIQDDIFCDIKIEDLELVKVGPADDKMILSNLPSNDPRWWCKVEDGYILNLKGERKNKEPYKYD